MSRKPTFPKNPLIQIIEIGLELWIRNQCKSIEKINLEINGSALEFLSGRISGAKLTAEAINFKGLTFNKIILESNSIHLNINFYNKNEKLSFKKDFKVEGTIFLDTKGINEIISSDNWLWVGNKMAQHLLESEKLERLDINENILELQGTNNEAECISKGKFKIEASSGSLKIKDINNGKSFLLPMDQSIHIDYASLENDKVLIDMKSNVKP